MNGDLSDLEIPLPFEFIVRGAALSLGAESDSKAKWKARIVDAVRARLEGGEWLHMGPIAVSICYFAADSATADMDNIGKPIFDAMNKVIYGDDKQVERVLIRKVDPQSIISFISPTPELLRAMDETKPLVYIKVSEVNSEESL
jgi:hypothetical protein